MREALFKLFSDTPFNAGEFWHIKQFNIWHFLYVIIIAGAIIALWRAFKDKSMETKEKLLRVLAVVLMFSYFSDYLFHDFVYATYDSTAGDYTGGGINMDKLPFHICTTMSFVIAFASFDKRLEKFYEPISVIAMIGPIMYVACPSTGVGGEFWCYRVVQTMFFHAVEMAWGILAISLGKVKLNWKNIWKSYVLILMITVWAKFGVTLHRYNWFFLLSNPLGIPGIDKPWLLPFIVPSIIFLAVIIIYTIDTVVKIIKRNSKNNQTV